MIWGFIQNQMLGMKWLNELIGKILTVVGLDVNSRLGGSIQFFIYDVEVNYSIAMFPDLCDFLYSKLLSTREK